MLTLKNELGGRCEKKTWEKKNTCTDTALTNSNPSAFPLATFPESNQKEDEEDRRDYDMHRLAREEKLKGKKLRGKRKRKEIAREKAPGQDFRVDVADERFAAVLEGDTRFGIDRTDSGFKVRAGGDPEARANGVFHAFLCSSSCWFCCRRREPSRRGREKGQGRSWSDSVSGALNGVSLVGLLTQFACFFPLP